MLDRERGGDGQAREAVEVGAYEPLLRPVTADRDGADELLADHQRVADHSQGGPLRIRLDDVGIPLRPGLIVVDESARARGGGDAEGARIGLQRAADLALGKPVPGPDHERVPLPVGQRDGGVVSAEELGRLPRDDGQPLLQTDRHEDLLHDIAE